VIDVNSISEIDVKTGGSDHMLEDFLGMIKNNEMVREYSAIMTAEWMTYYKAQAATLPAVCEKGQLCRDLISESAKLTVM